MSEINNTNKITIIFPVYNESKIISDNLLSVISYLKEHYSGWELVVVDNGSNDDTFEKISILAKAEPRLHAAKCQAKGIGIAFKEGLNIAKNDLVFFYGVDLPFGLDIIGQSFSSLKEADIVLGSKNHKDSLNRAPIKRKISSFIYNSLLKILFQLKIKDTQGSIAFKKSRVANIIPYCTANDAFFSTQLIIYGIMVGLKVEEIPIKYVRVRSESKINILKDGLLMFKQLLEEFKRYKSIKKEYGG